MPIMSVEVQGKKHLLGRRPPKSESRSFLDVTPLFAAVPQPPTSVPISSLCGNNLSQVYLNDQLGDCVIASHAHYVGNISSMVGQPFIYTSSQVTSDYHAVGGYIPGDPLSDGGCNIVDDLDFLQSTGFPSPWGKIMGYCDVDPSNQTAMQQFVWLAMCLNFGVNLPSAWINPAPQESGFTWDVAGSPDPSAGHCFLGFGYSPQGIIIDTWGMTGTITWAAIKKYCAASAQGELHSYLHQGIVDPKTGFAPICGLPLSTIATYFNALGGSVVVPPGPSPTPTPTPTPTPSPVTVNVPFGVYNLTITGTPVSPAITVPPPVTVSVGGQTITISATLS